MKMKVEAGVTLNHYIQFQTLTKDEHEHFEAVPEP